VYRTWLPSSGCQTANSFPYEEYIRTPEEHPRGCYEMQVGIPVEPV